jgi:DNA-binding CsgD family transcriptional regulator
VLQPLHLGPVVVDRSRYLPSMLLPLVEATRRGEDVVPALQTIVRGFGFDGFMYATANYHSRPDNDERIFVVTTLPLAWVMRYDQRAYVECDPRVLAVFDSSMPLLWDQASERGRNAKTDEFLDDAAAHGVGSGVAFAVYTPIPSRNLVSLSSSTPLICKTRRDEIARTLGDIVLFGQYFHELFVKGVIEKGLAPTSVGAPLSLRERQCLELASNGLTSVEIGHKLGIADRTVNFHFSNMISKLGVHNRHEAIAKGTRLGLLQSNR